MQSIISAVRGFLSRVSSFAHSVWRRFRTLPKRLQWGIGAVAVILVIALFVVLRAESPVSSENLRAVTVRSVGELSGGTDGGVMFGSVRSRAEAKILAEAGGVVEHVNTSLGARVGAGSILAELENASERAALLQAEGAYEATIAARSGVSGDDSDTQARNAYQGAYTDLDIALENYIDTVFGGPGPYGPILKIRGNGEDLSEERSAIRTLMNEWRRNLEDAPSRDPQQLLSEATVIADRVSLFLTDLSRTANTRDSNATAEQIAALITARGTVDGVRASLAAATSAYRSGSVGATAGADASVKQALGALRGAQANLEKTLVRAPIGGTVNFFPLRTGDYVTQLSHVATVAENSALEIVGYVSEDARTTLSVGLRVAVDDDHTGIITSIAPALDPLTRQIEIRVAVDGSTGLTNGQSVRVALPGAERATDTTDGPIYLPLSAVKLRAQDRVVFTVTEEGRLAATVVETGEVKGDTIEIRTPLAPELFIVSDARGLAEGERVRTAQ